MLAWWVVLGFAGPSFAQSLTFPTAGVFRPGVAMPITIESVAPALIQIRGNGVQGIDWPAAGRATVTVPLVIWRDTPGDLTLNINGVAQTVKIIPLAADPVPPALQETSADATAAHLRLRQADDDSFAVWSPGPSALQRRWLMLATLAATLAVGAVLPWRWRRAGPIVAIAVSAVACGAMAVFAPALPVRREVPVADEPGFLEIDYAATRPAVVREPVAAGLWLSPRSAEDVVALQPVLECDFSGKPQVIRIQMGENSRARFLGARR